MTVYWDKARQIARDAWSNDEKVKDIEKLYIRLNGANYIIARDSENNKLLYTREVNIDKICTSITKPLPEIKEEIWGYAKKIRGLMNLTLRI